MRIISAVLAVLATTSLVSASAGVTSGLVKRQASASAAVAEMISLSQQAGCSQDCSTTSSRVQSCGDNLSCLCGFDTLDINAATDASECALCLLSSTSLSQAQQTVATEAFTTFTDGCIAAVDSTTFTDSTGQTMTGTVGLGDGPAPTSSTRTSASTTATSTSSSAATSTGAASSLQVTTSWLSASFVVALMATI